MAFFPVLFVLPKFISSVAGDICFWDMRQKEPLKLLKAHTGSLTSCDIHDEAPIFAT